MTPTTLFTPFFFFNDTATTEIYTLSLHDALPIYLPTGGKTISSVGGTAGVRADIEDLSVVVNGYIGKGVGTTRSEEHTSELQSQSNLVCRLLLEKKKKKIIKVIYTVGHQTERADT